MSEKPQIEASNKIDASLISSNKIQKIRRIIRIGNSIYVNVSPFYGSGYGKTKEPIRFNLLIAEFDKETNTLTLIPYYAMKIEE